MAHRALCITGHLFLVSHKYYIHYSCKNTHEKILSGCLLATYFCCCVFWWEAQRFSILHRIDALVAKSSITYFIVYTLSCKELSENVKRSYFFIMAGIFISAYLSDKESRKEWCSEQHIRNHALLHFFCFIGSLYAFFPQSALPNIDSQQTNHTIL